VETVSVPQVGGKKEERQRGAQILQV
jgi:hypothetical protein